MVVRSFDSVIRVIGYAAVKAGNLYNAQKDKKVLFIDTAAVRNYVVSQVNAGDCVGQYSIVSPLKTLINNNPTAATAFLVLGGYSYRELPDPKVAPGKVWEELLVAGNTVKANAPSGHLLIQTPALQALGEVRIGDYPGSIYVIQGKNHCRVVFNMPMCLLKFQEKGAQVWSIFRQFGQLGNYYKHWMKSE